MNLHFQKAVSLQDKLGQTLINYYRDFNHANPTFYHIKNEDNGKFSIIIACESERSNTPLAGTMYKSAEMSTYEFEFTPIEPVAIIAGKEIKWVLDYDGWVNQTLANIIGAILGDFALQAHYVSDKTAIVDPTADVEDFYINNGFAKMEIADKVNIEPFLEQYNLKFGTAYTNLNELFYNFWSDFGDMPLEDIMSISVNGFNVGQIIVTNTRGKFLTLP